MRNHAQTIKQQQAREQVKDQPFPETVSVNETKSFRGKKLNIQSDPGIYLN